jgi:hypothetical protein
MNKFGFKIFPEKTLIIKHYKGSININDLFRFTKETSLSKDFNPNYNVLNDMRECELEISVDDIVGFVNKVRSDNKMYGKRNIVFLTSKPNQVIFSELVNHFKSEGLVNLLTCSTIETALKHLNIHEKDRAFIESVLLKFNN